MITTIEFELNKQSIDKAIRQLRAYKKRIEKRTDELISVMCQEGERYARVALTHIDTGDTLNSIIGYRDGDKGIIQAGGHAIWIEFGTGVKGKQSPHPSSDWLGKQNWQYAVGKFIRKRPNGLIGWYYPTDEFDENGNPIYAFTQGLESNHFLFDACVKLEMNFKENAKKVFSK